MTNLLTPETAAGYAYAAGFRGSALVTITAIAGAESGYDADKPGDIALEDATWGPSLGLWQIRSLKAQSGSGRERDATRLKNPAFNARSAYTISSGGTNFKPWTTYTDGSYKAFLPRAQQAASGAAGQAVSADGAAATADASGSTTPTYSLPAFLKPDFMPLPVTIGGQQPGGLGGFTLIGGNVSFTTQEASELTLVFEDNDYRMISDLKLSAGTPQIQDDNLLGTLVEALGLKWRVRQLGTGPGPKGPQTTLICQPSGVMRMRSVTPAAAKNSSPTDYMQTLAQQAGLAFRGQQSARLADIGPANTTDQLAGFARKESAWEIGQRLAASLNFVAYESRGVYHFGAPAFLAESAKLWQLSVRGMRWDPDVGGDVVAVVGWPSLQATRLAPAGAPADFPQRVLDCQISQADAQRVSAGDQINVAGVPAFQSTASRIAGLTINSVTWDFADGMTPARMQAADRTEFFATASSATNTTAAGLVAGEGNTTGGLANRQAKSALDFVTLCLRQIGDSYVWGAHPTAGSDPDAFDCSGLVGWAAGQVGVSFHGSSGMQYAACARAGTLISVQKAAYTRGAVLFEGAAGSQHIAVSLGDGKHTIEARGRAYGVNKEPIEGRPWSAAGLIPGMRYS